MSLKEEMKSLTIKDPFWSQQPEILYNRDRLIEFLPRQEMSDNEKLNALTRFFIYIGVIFAIMNSNIIYMYLTLFGVLFTYFLHKNLVRVQNMYRGNVYGGNSNGHMNGNYDYDSNGPTMKSTKDNPFMNVLLTDYVDDPNRPPAGDISDDKVKQQVEKNFNFNLYKDVDDIWDKNNSQRQYYTNPNTTIPNDRDSLVKWLYGNMACCKDGNMSACLRYETPLAHGQII